MEVVSLNPPVDERFRGGWSLWFPWGVFWSSPRRSGRCRPGRPGRRSRPGRVLVVLLYHCLGIT